MEEKREREKERGRGESEFGFTRYQKAIIVHKKEKKGRKDFTPGYGVRALFFHDQLYAPADLILRTVPERL